MNRALSTLMPSLAAMAIAASAQTAAPVRIDRIQTVDVQTDSGASLTNLAQRLPAVETASSNAWALASTAVQSNAVGALLFRIPNLPNDQPWTDFKLMGSVDGFTNTVWRYYSADPNNAWNILPGGKPDVYFTDSGAGVPFRWLPQPVDNSVASALTDTNSFVGGWVVLVQGLTLTREQIERMQWAYSLVVDNTVYATDPGSRQIWWPVTWERLVEPGWKPSP